MAELAEKTVEAVICTLHFGPCGRKGADVEGAFAWLREQGSSIRFCLGNEILHSGTILEDVRRGNARRMAGSDLEILKLCCHPLFGLRIYR